MTKKSIEPTAQPLKDDISAHLGELFATMTDADFSDTLDNSPYYIGIMSGTSLDGVDAVLCRFYADDEMADNDGKPVAVIASHSMDFPSDLRAALLALTTPNGINEFIKSTPADGVQDAERYAFESELDVFGWASVYYGYVAAELVQTLLAKTELSAMDIAAIGCHGQTVRHRPEWAFSLQLLDPNVLAEHTGIAVVSDFRRRDMAVGGQGAPLVPAFHQAMFGADDSVIGVLNLGGIANITLLARDGQDVQGFDTGVANLLMDAWIQRHTGAAYDKDGAWAASGEIIAPLLKLLLAHPYFQLSPPKSTGREDFHLAWLDGELHKLGASHPDLRYSPADVQATLTELTAISASDAISAHLPADTADKTLLVCGGGALNSHLMARLTHHLPMLRVQSTCSYGVAAMLIEGMAFAWLARQTMLMQAGNVPAVTGASKAVVLGQVCF